MSEPTRMHWAVVNRFYPMPKPHSITEFEFGNGVTIHYDPEVGGIYVHLPAREAVLSSGFTTETLHEQQFLLNVDRINGVPVGIEIVRAEAVGEGHTNEQ